MFLDVFRNMFIVLRVNIIFIPLSPCVTFHLSIIPSSSQSKEVLSQSEMDLSKPKGISSFSFSFKRKKAKDEENISQSTFVLQSPATEEKEVTQFLKLCFS